jgi:hypothetical protein
MSMAATALSIVRRVIAMLMATPAAEGDTSSFSAAAVWREARDAVFVNGPRHVRR